MGADILAEGSGDFYSPEIPVDDMIDDVLQQELEAKELQIQKLQHYLDELTKDLKFIAEQIDS